MKEIEEIWDNHNINKHFTKRPIELTNHSAISELDKLGKVLKIEIVIELIITFAFFILKNRMSEFTFIMSMVIAACGLIFSCYGYSLSRKVKLEDNSLLFLNKTVNMLEHFVIKYLVFLQIILIFIYILLGHVSGDISFIEWALSKFGIKAGLLIIIIDVICLLYGYFFYAKKYFRLKKVLKDF